MSGKWFKYSVPNLPRTTTRDEFRSISHDLRIAANIVCGDVAKGALYVFPTERDAQDFAKARFGPTVTGESL